MPKHRLGAALALALLFCAAADAAPFGFAPPVSTPTYGEAESVAIGDVDGDGRDDLVVATNAYSANTWSNTVLIYPQQADGTLAQPHAVPYTTSYGNARGLVLADIDADGVLDIAVGYGGGIALLRRDGAGGFVLRSVVTNRGGDVLASLDVDRNGVADIIALSHNGPAAIYYSDGYGGIASQQTLVTQAGGFNDLEIGDLNGDGVDDLAVMSGQSYAVPNLTVHRHDGVAGWLTPQSYFVGSNESTRGLAVGDFDDDGRDDVVMSRGGNSPTWLWQYRQDASGQLQAGANLPSYDIPATIEAADLDRDGRDDIGVLHSGWSRLGFYLQGDAGLGVEQLVTIPYQSHYRQQGLAFGDLDGDGCTDAAIALDSGVLTLAGHDCAATADLAVAVRGESHKRVAVDVSHLGGTASVAAEVLVEFRARRFSRIDAPPACAAQPSLDRVRAYRCITAPMSAGVSETLRFAFSGLSSVVVAADVSSNAPDPEESNNVATATIPL